MNDHQQDWPRLGITIGILAAFAYAIAFHWGQGVEETLKNLAVMSVGYWLGSSRGAQTQTENVGKALDLANNPSPQAVVVTNDPSSPVPTTEAK